MHGTHLITGSRWRAGSVSDRRNSLRPPVADAPGSPFFLHVNFTAPHDPLLLPPGYEKKYDPKRLPLPANFMHRHPFDHGNLDGRDEKLLPSPRSEGDVRDELAAYLKKNRKL